MKENVLYRIADQSAFEYFRHYTGNQYNLFMNYCLAVYEDEQDSFYVRSILFADPESGSVTLNGHVPEGTRVQIGNADKEKTVQSCTVSICGALASYPGLQPAAALLISCAGRKMMMGMQIVQEVQIVRRYLGDIPFCGFYSYGEFGPLEQGKRSLFHGATFVTLLFGPTD